MSTIPLGSFRSELSDNTYTQSEDRQASLLSDITKLQTMESNLYKKLEAADANNAPQDEQNAMVAKIKGKLQPTLAPSLRAPNEQQCKLHAL